MVQGAEVVRVGGGRGGMRGNRVLGDGLISLGHQLGDSLQQGAVGLNEVLDGGYQFLPLALGQRDKVIGTEVLCVHDCYLVQPGARKKSVETEQKQSSKNIPGQGLEPR